MTNKKEYIIFFGSSSSSLKILSSLKHKYNIALIVTTKHKNNIMPNYSILNNIAILEVDKLSSKFCDEIESVINKYKVRVGVVVDFGLIIPADLINTFSSGIINVHYSLLPKYRGASPIESALLANDGYTGISFILIEPSLDSGPIISQYKYKIKNNDQQLSLTDALDILAVKYINQDLAKYLSKSITPIRQDNSKASFCGLIKKEDGLINIKDSTQDIIAKIRAFYHWPSAWLIHNQKRIKLYGYGITLTINDEENSDKTLSFIRIGSSLYLKAKDGLLEITKLQIEGKSIIDSKSAINGYSKLLGI